jgi:hypothetical protein
MNIQMNELNSIDIHDKYYVLKTHFCLHMKVVHKTSMFK